MNRMAGSNEVASAGRLARAIHAEPAAPAELHELVINARRFKLRAADNRGQRAAASMLIDKMYSRRGYDTGFLSDVDEPNRITLTASDDDGSTLGTIAVGVDSDAGLLVDELYRDELDRARGQGRVVCEFGKLAVDSERASKRVLASLFHLAYIYARLLHDATDVFIEVNPRHAAYYRRMLGFEPAAETRICARVNAPAVLLRLDLAHAGREIARVGGQAELARGERSLYPFFFSEREQGGIAERLRAIG